MNRKRYNNINTGKIWNFVKFRSGRSAPESMVGSSESNHVKNECSNVGVSGSIVGSGEYWRRL